MRYLILQTFLTLALLIYPLSLSAQNSFSLSVDLNSAAGDQAVTSLNTVPDQVVAIEIFGKDIQSANGLAVRFEYDASQVIYDGFDAGDVLPNAQALPEQGTGYVEIGIVSLGGQATANNGLVGTVRFRTTTAFSGTEIRLVRAELSRSGRFETIMPNIGIALQGAPTPTDFSLSLDTDSASGDQAVTSVNVSTEEVVAIQIFGKDIQNANGLAVRFEHDASQVVYEGFDVGDVLPNAQALPEQGAGYVEIGIASLGGQATANSGLVGTIRFSTTAAFTSTAIRLVRAELGRGGRFETIMPNIGIALQGASTPANFSLSLDVDGSAGDQAVTSLNTSADQVVAIQIFGKDIQNANGVSIRFEYDASQVVYEGFDVGDVLPNAQALPSQGTNPTFVEIGIVSLGGQATANNGLIGTVRFRTTTAFSGTEIRLVRAELGRGGQIESVTIDGRVALELQALTPDFNGDGVVNFADFLVLTNLFGAYQGDGRYEAKYDLDSDGTIGFGDFLIFSSSFDKGGSPPGGGGGSSPDLIVESPSVSDSTLTVRQFFTLQTTVRNQGSGQAAATILHYYQSIDAIISSSDTRVGSEAVGPLNASSRSVESINLHAPSSVGTYYYGACVASVSGESNTENNCSRAVRVTVSSGSTTDVDIPDANLRAAIETTLGKASGAPISRAEMTSLTRLDARNSNISDLTGLEFATNLTRLDLGPDRTESNRGVSGDKVGVIRQRQSFANSNEFSNLSPLSGLTRLEYLDLGNNVIKDVSVLSGLTRLTYLDLYENIISDVSALSNLTNLTSLDLYNNYISDVSVLSNLTNLETLNLQTNLISDVSVLSNLTNLKTLNLEENLISDVSVLSNLTNLADLDLEENTISDISVLANLSNLKWLDLYNNVISDASALANLTGLEKLFFGTNVISDLTPLSNLTNLTDLALSRNVISEVSELSNLTNLERLSLSINTISDFTPLSNLTNLERLFFAGNTISDLTPLSNLTNLINLQGQNNNISDLSPLANLTNLGILYFHGNPISDVSPLANLTNLRTIGLNRTAISDVSAFVSALSNSTNLRSVFLGQNGISDISALSSMTSLGYLVLHANAISDISALSNLTNLRTLLLYSNTITDLSPLVANTGLDEGDRIDVRNNPLSATSLNTHIPALQARGVNVQFGAGKPAVEETELHMPYPENEDIVNGGKP